MVIVRIEADVVNAREALALHYRLLAKREEIAQSKDGNCLIDLRGMGGIGTDAERIIRGFIEWVYARDACSVLVLLV